jgi:hypothetical protein
MNPYKEIVRLQKKLKKQRKKDQNDFEALLEDRNWWSRALCSELEARGATLDPADALRERDELRTAGLAAGPLQRAGRIAPQVGQATAGTGRHGEAMMTEPPPSGDLGTSGLDGFPVASEAPVHPMMPPEPLPHPPEGLPVPYGPMDSDDAIARWHQEQLKSDGLPPEPPAATPPPLQPPTAGRPDRPPTGMKHGATP